jgi:isoleucyl-tRNA synthetase
LRHPEHPGDAVRLEEDLLRSWREEDLFRESLRRTEGLPEFVFYEGPPTANGRPDGAGAGLVLEPSGRTG